MIHYPSFRIFIFTVILITAAPGLNAQQKAQRIKLNYFDKIPAEVDGCSGLYTYDTVSLKRKKYIVVTDLSENAIININGEQIQLKYTGEGAMAGANSQPKKIFNGLYKGTNYQLILNTRPEKKPAKGEESETWRDRGTLEVIIGDRHVRMKVHGISGC